MEQHPENQPPFDILLGLLGKEVRGATPAPPAAEACAGLAAPYNVERAPERGCVRVGQSIRFLAFDFPANSSVTLRLLCLLEMVSPPDTFRRTPHWVSEYSK